MRSDLTGKVALVTGGASGIGWATARRLRDLGATVMIADRDGDRAHARAGELGSDHAAIAIDIARPSGVAAMFDAATIRFGRIDILVNNAGRTDDRGLPLIEHDAASFEAVMSVNLGGTVEATRTAAELMRKHGGSIVNVASGAAFRALPLRGSYSTSKAGVVSLTQALADQLPQPGVRVNAVAPGFVRTELVDGLVAAGRLDLEEAAAKIPLGRVGEPEEIAAAICYLASPAANGIHGAVLPVDGGSSAFGASRATARHVPEQEPGGVIAVMGNGLAETCVALLMADGMEAVHLPTDMSANPEALGERLAALAARHRGLRGFIDAVDYRAAASPMQQVSQRFLSAQAVGRVLCPQGFGAYACMSMRDGFRDPVDSRIACDATAMLVRTLACEWAPHGVRANALTAAAHAGSTEMLIFLVSDDASFVVGSVVDI